MRWCLVLLAVAASGVAHAQTQVQAAMQRAGIGPQVAGDRAVHTPLEVVWLRALSHAQMWSGRALARHPGCDRAGAPREGCGIADRPVWRYVFGNGLHSQATPLFFSEGSRISIAGTGRVYVVPSSGAPMLVLAAGTVVQISDASYPSIHIEVRAPQDEPLSLGNVASADIRNLIAMIARPPAQASAKAPVLPKAPQPEPLEVAGLASGVEVSARIPQPRFEIAAADLSALSGLNLPQLTERIVAADPLAGTDLSQIAGATELSDPLPIVAAATVPVATAPMQAVPIAPAAPVTSDLAKMRAEIEAEIERERARLAQSLQLTGKRFRFGT